MPDGCRRSPWCRKCASSTTAASCSRARSPTARRCWPAQAVGADLAYIGTRFTASKEANATDGNKQCIIDSAGEEIVYTNLFTGVHGNYLKRSIAAAGLDPDDLPVADKSKMNFGSGGNTKAKAWRDIWGAGQGVGQIFDAPPAAEIVARAQGRVRSRPRRAVGRRDGADQPQASGGVTARGRHPEHLRGSDSDGRSLASLGTTRQRVARMIRSLYDWVIRLAGSPRALPALGVISFLESSVFPIPPDVMLIPMVLANRAKAFTIAAVCTVCSVLGGLLGYAIGYYFFETLGEWVVRTYHADNGLAAFRHGFEQYGIWIILIKGLTPIPYKLVTIASGRGPLRPVHVRVGVHRRRGVRFFIVAALLWKFGEPIRTFVEKRLTLLTWLFLIALIGGFVAFRYIF